MRAAVLHEAPGDLVVEDLTIAEPIGREVLIRTKASGLCHSDLHVIEGLLPLPSLPAALGHEASGIVEAVGPDVTAFAPGDHVITCLTQFCGVCPECHVGRVFICSNRHDLARGPELEPTLSLSGTPVLPMAGLGAFATDQHFGPLDQGTRARRQVHKTILTQPDNRKPWRHQIPPIKALTPAAAMALPPRLPWTVT